MSQTNMSAKNQNLLWAISGGRCQYEGCNKILHTDILTKYRYNSAYIAHIVADSPDGPRGDHDRSHLLSDNISNLILLCDVHHRLIDNVSVALHPESKLLDMKRKHEDRIQRLTSISPNMSTEIVLYSANIGHNNALLSYHQACEAILDKYYPADDNAIEIGVKNICHSDDTKSYWSTEEENLCLQFNLKIKPKLMIGGSSHYSLFALAPQPLLIRLGVLLNDIVNVRVYQKHRETSTWKWQTGLTNTDYKINEPTQKNKTPVLAISLSANIDNGRIHKVLGDNISVWELTIDTPNSDFLKTEELLSKFRITMRSLFNDIKTCHGSVPLHVFPAMPLSAAVELGRVWMPKADMPLVIYDENKAVGGFYETITIK